MIYKLKWIFKRKANQQMKRIERMVRDIEREVAFSRHAIGKKALNDRVMEAIRKVPRHEFVPGEAKELAYQNGPLPIQCGQTISQPFMVALMTDLLNPQPEHAVLEVGAGSGYQAAVLAHLVKRVYSVEIIPQLAEKASERLRRLGYDNVEIRSGDGYYGWLEHAPFDGIIVTAAAPYIPQPLIDQLKAGGRMVIPIGQPYAHQELKVVEKNNGVDSRSIFEVAFVPLTGEHD